MIRIGSYKKPRVQHFWNRQGYVRYIFLILLMAFAYRVISIRTLTADDLSLKQRAINQSSEPIIETARRGDIVDRNGEILASNLILKKINLNPMQLQTEFIPKLAQSLDMPFVELNEILAKKRENRRGYYIIKKNIPLTDPVINRINKLKKERINVCKNITKKNDLSLIDKALNMFNVKKSTPKYTTTRKCSRQLAGGITIEEDAQRYYPKGASMAPLIGRINHDKEGISGIEGEFENILSGQDGEKHLRHTGDSSESYFNPVNITKLEHGQDIELTIDSGIQFHSYNALKKSVLFHEAESGSAIVLSTNGEVLAMANYPADDPNNKQVYSPEHYRNRVLSDKIEPGSTMKPFTMLLALDQNKITATEDELIDVTKKIGHIRPDKKYKEMTIKLILQKSHNLGTVNVSEMLTKEDMYNIWNNLGFGHPLGLIPSIENSGSLKHFESWGDIDKRTLSYGHGPMETNLAQLARAYLVFANNGSIPSLKLINGANYNENIIKIFNKETIDKIGHILDSVVSDKGSGYRAQIGGYSVAGKTGTAEKVINGKYSKNGDKRTFFVGFVPAKMPKYIMAVRLDYPKKCYAIWYPNPSIPCQGSNSASMVFRDAMEKILTSDNSIEVLSES
jgi:cell division protein FtsI (penicillin-binding protein 3)